MIMKSTIELLIRLEKRIMRLEKAANLEPPKELLIHPKAWRQFTKRTEEEEGP